MNLIDNLPVPTLNGQWSNDRFSDLPLLHVLFVSVVLAFCFVFASVACCAFSFVAFCA